MGQSYANGAATTAYSEWQLRTVSPARPLGIWPGVPFFRPVTQRTNVLAHNDSRKGIAQHEVLPAEVTARKLIAVDGLTRGGVDGARGFRFRRSAFYWGFRPSSVDARQFTNQDYGGFIIHRYA